MSERSGLDEAAFEGCFDAMSDLRRETRLAHSSFCLTSNAPTTSANGITALSCVIGVWVHSNGVDGRWTKSDSMNRDSILAADMHAKTASSASCYPLFTLLPLFPLVGRYEQHSAVKKGRINHGMTKFP